MKFALIAAAFFGPALFAAYYFGTFDQQRKPSSVVYDENGDVLYANDSLEDLEANRKNFSGRSLAPENHQLFRTLGEVSSDEVSRNFPGLKIKRAAKLRLIESELMRARTGGRRLRVNLFPDTNLNVQFHEPSRFGVNHSDYSGFIADEPESLIQFTSFEGTLNGRFKSKNREFRIAPGVGKDLYVVELVPEAM